MYYKRYMHAEGSDAVGLLPCRSKAAVCRPSTPHVRSQVAQSIMQLLMTGRPLVQVSARTRLLWTLGTAVPALLSVATFGTLPIFVMEHISLSGKGAGPLGPAAADVAVGVLFGLAATILIGHLRVVLAQAVWPHIWVSLQGVPRMCRPHYHKSAWQSAVV